MRKFFRWHASLSYRQQVSCSILAAIILATLLLYCLGISSFLMSQRLIETRSTTSPTPAGSPVPVGTALPLPAETAGPALTATAVITPPAPPVTGSP